MLSGFVGVPIIIRHKLILNNSIIQKPFQKNDLYITINYNMNISTILVELRNLMKKHHIDAYIISSSDPHQSEYVADHWKIREWISGFNGSAGTVVVTQQHAGLWTDSRYFLQAEEQISTNEFELHKIFDRTTPGHIDWINKHVTAGSTIAIDGWLFSVSQGKAYRKILHRNDNKLISHLDLITPIWTSRPTLPKNQAFVLDNKFAGNDVSQKLQKIRKHLFENKADSILISALDEIAWTLNIRSSDIEYNPLCISYLIVNNKEAILFVDPFKVSQIEQHLKTHEIQIYAYDKIQDVLAKNDFGRLMIDPATCNIANHDAIKNSEVHLQSSIVDQYKGIKSKVEIENIKQAMIKDGTALCHAFHWLESKISDQKISECDFSDKLYEFRKKQDYFFGESFPSIVGYESNGAIIHYRPEQETCKDMAPEGVLLCDSGAQYFDGTTDITRTIKMGEVHEEVIKANTLVLKGHINLATAKFPIGTTGVQIDILARKPLWDAGMNFLHGTGHGVGFFLNVHEGPHGITAGPSRRGNVQIRPGMVISNEPGYYEDGKYGIRIENLVVCKDSDEEGFLEFETITLYPIDKKLIDKSMLDSKQIDWLNGYHEKVWEKLSPKLDENLRKWLQDQCSVI